MDMIPVDIMIDRGCMSLMHGCRSDAGEGRREREQPALLAPGRALLLAPAGSLIDPAASRQFQFQFLVSVDT